MDILTFHGHVMCKEDEQVIRPAIHSSSVLQRYYIRIFPTFPISDFA